MNAKARRVLDTKARDVKVRHLDPCEGHQGFATSERDRSTRAPEHTTGRYEKRSMMFREVLSNSVVSFMTSTTYTSRHHQH